MPGLVLGLFAVVGVCDFCLYFFSGLWGLLWDFGSLNGLN